MSYGSAAIRGGLWGMRLGALFGPLGAAVGTIVGGAVAVGGAYIASEILADQMNKADAEAEKSLDADAEKGACDSCGATQEEQEERQEELEKEAGVEQRTKGKTRHGEKSGGIAQAHDDFDSLRPDNIKDIDTSYGPGRTGTLKNGNRVTVRPGSSEGPPTLETRRPNGRGVEIRYPNLGM